MFLHLLLASPSEVRAESVLPREAETQLLKALDPIIPGGALTSPWRLGNVELTTGAITLHLDAPNQHGSLELSRNETGEPSAQSSQSFHFRLRGPVDAPGFKASARLLMAAISRSDHGTYYRQVEARDGPPQRAPDPIDIGLWLGFLLALAFMLSVLPKRGVNRRGMDPGDLLCASILLGVALGLRLACGPLTFLHENAHGVHLLERAAGLTFVERPMAGQVAMADAFAFLGLPLRTTLVVGTAALASLSAPLAFALGRSLNLSRWPALASGALVASSPILVRMTASEDAFGCATTFAILGAWCAVRATKSERGTHVVAALLWVAVAGHFRPVFYTAALPILAALVVLPGWDVGKRWFRRPSLFVAVTLFFLGAADDLPGLVARLDAGSPMTPGWWRGEGLRSWPLFDPSSTPPWFMGFVALSLSLAWRSPHRPAMLWLVFLGLWLTFVYTSDNAWPASLRYAVAYIWVGCMLIGVGLESLPLDGRRKTMAVGFVLLCACSAPFSHQTFVSHRFAQQQELDFQEAEVLPFLLGTRDAVVVTVWPELGHMSGTLLTAPLRRAGVKVLALGETEEARFTPRLYWYRGLACWAKRDSEADLDLRSMRPECRALEATGRWRAVVTRKLDPDSEADWIVLGDGTTPVEVGLFVRSDDEGPGTDEASSRRGKNRMGVGVEEQGKRR